MLTNELADVDLVFDVTAKGSTRALDARYKLVDLAVDRGVPSQGFARFFFFLANFP